MNKLILLILVLGLTACSERIVKEPYEIPVPVAYVPKPPKIDRPILVTSTLTEEQKKNVGELVKAHRVALQQVLVYASLLETTVRLYDNMHTETASNLEKFKVDNRVVDLPDFGKPLTHFEKSLEAVNTISDDKMLKNYVETDK